MLKFFAISLLVRWIIATAKSFLFLEKLFFNLLQRLINDRVALFDDLHSQDTSILYRVMSKGPVLDNYKLNQKYFTLKASFFSLMMIFDLFMASSLQMSLRRGVVDE